MFNRKSRLKIHVELVHEATKEHKCIECSMTFSGGIKLKRHIKINHQGANISNLSIAKMKIEKAFIQNDASKQSMNK